MIILIFFFQTRKIPENFEIRLEPPLKNIVTGEIASEQVDVDEAIPIGGKILNDDWKRRKSLHFQQESNCNYYESAK